MSEPLLRSKLAVPRTVADLVPRPRLETRLEEAVRGPLTLIVAPAGFGKTTLVSEWLMSTGRRAAWVSLDPGDNQGSRLWRYLFEAIHALVPGYGGEEVRSVLPLLHTSNFEQGLILWLNALDRLDQEIMLVLDDFHVIQEERLLDSFAYFAGHLPMQVHVILLSRSEPGFSLARMEARQALLRLETEDMRFTEEEGGRFLDGAEVLLNGEEISALVRKTEGWITGLKLASMAMRRQEDPGHFVREFGGDNRAVRQYLLEEVFAGQSPRMQQFLFRCSILKRWNAAVCQAVTGFEDSRELLEELLRTHLFVVALDHRGRWFRFHHLFAEFLEQRLEQDSGGRVEELYLAAGDWFYAQGLEEEAVEYYLQGKYYLRAVQLLSDMTSRVVDWEWSLLQKWLSSIPSEMLLKHPVLFFSYVNALIAEEAGDLTEGKRLLYRADEWYSISSKDMTEAERAQYLAMRHYVRGTLMVFGENDLRRAKEEYAEAVRHAPDGIRIIFGLPEKPVQPMNVRTYKIGKGHAARAIAEPYTMQMAELYRAVNPIFLGKLFLNHAEVLYYWNDLPAASSYLAEAMAWIMQNPSRPEHDLVPAWILQAKLKAGEGRLAEALDLLESGRRRMKWMDVPRGAEILELEGFRLQLLSGNAEPALAWGRTCRLTAQDRVSLYELYDYQLFARVLVTQQRLEEAADLLDRLLYLAERELRPIDAAEIRCITALMLLDQGDRQKALVQLEEGLRTAEDNGFIGVFLEEDETVRHLLHELAQEKQKGYFRGKEASSLSFVRSVIAAAGGLAQPADSPLESLFTAREMDVFQGLLDRLSGKEIAERLNITYETVKTHRSRIYGKLGVSSREEAVRAAARLAGDKKE